MSSAHDEPVIWKHHFGALWAMIVEENLHLVAALVLDKCGFLLTSIFHLPGYILLATTSSANVHLKYKWLATTLINAITIFY